MQTLFVIQGFDQGQRFELCRDHISVGRDAENTIQLHDDEVSRQHAKLRRVKKGYQLVDCTSSNGTFINAKSIDQQVLRSGDRVQIGRTLMLYTHFEESSRGEVDGNVDIVSAAAGAAESRILHTATPDDVSQLFDTEQATSSWLSNARSNLQVIYRTALEVSHTLDIDQLLQRIMELIFEWVEADRGLVLLVDHPSGDLVPKVRRNRKGAQVEPTIEISSTILDYVTEHTKGVLSSDARQDDRWNATGSIVRLGVREAICVPMQGRYGVVGVIYIDTYTPPGQVLQKDIAHRFSEDHLKLMVAIGHQAALAIEDTSYYSALVQAERLAAVGQTIATLSHHIKNILQGIRGGSFLIDEGLQDDDATVVRKGWKIVEKNQEKISNLVMDMLSYSKDREPELVPANLNTLVTDIVELMQARADEATVSIQCQFEDTMPTLMFDPESLHRAILNVVTNGIDACEQTPEGAIFLETGYDPANQLATVVITDNGPGIPPADQEKIFNLFESKKGARGTGLGLAVTRKILEEYNGRVEVTSAPGQGSRFTLAFPAVAATTAPPKPT
ncbi:MAG: histidine kinase [Planctomycetaceae bacterium]|nr:histidine kinase [Planctomycetaceae bacterium]